MALDASLVIPTYNKREFLELTLASLINQTSPHEKFEVIIIDDGSSDGTHELFSQSIRFPFKLVYVKQENKGRAAARNAGIVKAQGATIVFIDDDQIVPPQFLEHHMWLHQQNQNIVVGGYRSQVFSLTPAAPVPQAILASLRKSVKKTVNAFDIKPGYPLITAEDILSDFHHVPRFAYGMDTNFERISREYGEELENFFIPWIFFVTSNVSVGKHHLLEVGLFDENFTGWGGEDYELGYRLYKHGLRYKLSREAISYHQHHSRKIVQSRESELRNYRYFCEKHPDIAIYLYWRKTYDGLSIKEYNTIVREYDRRAETSPDCPLLTDYKVIVKHHLETKGFDLAERQHYWQLPSLAEKALQDKEYETALSFALKYIRLNTHRAEEQQSILKDFPAPAQWGSYSHLNNVARCWLVVASVHTARGELQKAVEAKHKIVVKYPYAQHWRDTDGFVKLAEVAKNSVSE